MKIINSISDIISTIFLQNSTSLETATFAHKLIFILYVLSLIFTLVLTILLWKASNKAQDAVIADANAKIASVTLTTEQAKKDAAIARTESEQIRSENIILSGNLTKAIADADIEKQKLAQMQIEVANARRKQAEAEKALEDLRVSAKKAARGVTSLYGFRGEKRNTSSGVSNTIIGEETTVFEKLVTLEKAGKFPEIISLCKSQIAKTPDWLTPYLFMGVAQANMGFKCEAILNLEHVIKNAPGDPNYQHVADILKQLKNE